MDLIHKDRSFVQYNGIITDLALMCADQRLCAVREQGPRDLVSSERDHAIAFATDFRGSERMDLR
jgi:hypothetical protein